MFVQSLFMCLAVLVHSGVSGNCSTKVSACLNGGTCVDMQGSFTCMCTKGFTGSNCSYRLPTTTTTTTTTAATTTPQTTTKRRVTSCPDLHISNGKVTIYRRGKIRIAVFKCNKGFKFSGGPKMRMCKNGVWLYGRRIATCRYEKPKPKPCTFSRSIRRGSVRMLRNTPSLTRVLYFCLNGYSLVGRAVRTCKEGQWDSLLKPYCIRAKLCKPLKNPANSQRLGRKFTSGSRVRFICDNGYELIGAQQLKCQRDGLWDKPVPKCEKKDPLRDLKNAANQLRRHFINKLELLTTDSRARSGLSSGAAGLDLVFVFDSSASVGTENFKKGIEFAKTIITEFGVSNSSTGTRVAVVVFSTNAKVIFNLKTKRIVDQNTAINTLKNLKLQGGGTATALALDTVISDVVPEVRNNSKKALFLITDGKSNTNRNPSRPAKLLRDGYYFEIFAIGVTSHVFEKELRDIASEPFRTHVYLLEDFQSLETLKELITKKGSNYSECGIAGDTQLRDTSDKLPIVGRRESKSGAWPWLAAIFVRGSFRCTGAYIAEGWVLTVAHCFYHDDKVNGTDVVVQLGEHDRTFVEGSEQNIRVQKIITHKRSSRIKLEFDFALLKLQHKAKLTAYVRTICLPVQKDRVVIRTNGFGVVAGWGSAQKTNPVNNGRPVYPVIMQTRLQFISKYACERNISHPLTDRMICVVDRHGDKDDCSGDIGSPLMVYRPDRSDWTLAGMSVWGEGCAYKGKYGVYSNLLTREYLRWIRRRTKLK